MNIKEILNNRKLSIFVSSFAVALAVVVISAIGVKHAEALTSNAQGLAELIATTNALDGDGGSFTSGDDSLSELIVLGGLFPTSTNALTNARNLAGLIAVDNVTGGSNGSFTSGSDDNLSELIVLSGLFPTSTNASTNAKNLAGLIAVDNVTGGSNGSFTSGSDDLAELLVLNGLFLDP